MWDRYPERIDRLRDVLERRQPDLTVVFENIHDPHNCNAILRSCDAVGVHEVQLLYNREKFPNFERFGKRSSMGTRKWIERREFTTALACYDALRARGFRILVSRLDDGAQPLHNLDLTRPSAFVFGNEKDGVSAEAVAGADAAFVIPMVGMARSLNVSVAAAVTLYEAFRQRRAAGFYDTPRLDEQTIAELMERWSTM